MMNSFMKRWQECDGHLFLFIPHSTASGLFFITVIMLQPCNSRQEGRLIDKSILITTLL